MPTIQQLVRKGRVSIKKKSKSLALKNCPQRREFVLEFILLHLSQFSVKKVARVS